MILVRVSMVQYVLKRKYLGKILSIFLVPDATALAWNWPRQGHLWHTTAWQLPKSWEIRPPCTLWGSVPPAPSPLIKRKPALPTVTIVHDIVIKQIFPQLGGRISQRQDPRGWSQQGVTLSSAKYTQWYLPPRVTCPNLERTGIKGRVQTGEYHQDNYRARH